MRHTDACGIQPRPLVAPRGLPLQEHRFTDNPEPSYDAEADSEDCTRRDELLHCDVFDSYYPEVTRTHARTHARSHAQPCGSAVTRSNLHYA